MGDKKGKEPLWVNFKYEHISHFCFVCGKMDHEIKSCKHILEASRASFGRWLKFEVEDIAPAYVQSACRGNCSTTVKGLETATGDTASE